MNRTPLVVKWAWNAWIGPDSRFRIAVMRSAPSLFIAGMVKR